jgi:hypothetical protein
MSAFGNTQVNAYERIQNICLGDIKWEENQKLNIKITLQNKLCFICTGMFHKAEIANNFFYLTQLADNGDAQITYVISEIMSKSFFPILLKNK